MSAMSRLDALRALKQWGDVRGDLTLSMGDIAQPTLDLLRMPGIGQRWSSGAYISAAVGVNSKIFVTFDQAAVAGQVCVVERIVITPNAATRTHVRFGLTIENPLNVLGAATVNMREWPRQSDVPAVLPTVGQLLRKGGTLAPWALSSMEYAGMPTGGAPIVLPVHYSFTPGGTVGFLIEHVDPNADLAVSVSGTLYGAGV